MNARRSVPASDRTADERVLLTDFEGGGAVPLHYADGSCGIRGVEGAAALPSTITLASTFDAELVEEYGIVLGRELRASGHNALLAPALDLARDPRSGRIGESFGEDPLLAGELGAAMTRGIQSQGVMAVAKHYVANNVEHLRTGEGPLRDRSDAVDVLIDNRALHETYLEPFRRVVQHGGVAALLGSYNRVNGEYVCESSRLLDLPRSRWGFHGAWVPDFLFAVRDVERALAAGLDLPGLGDGASGRTSEMLAALPDERVAELADHVRRATRIVDLVSPTREIDASALADERALELAERVAIDGAVLLRNDSVLPLAVGSAIALIGADAIEHRLTVGGAAAVTLSPDRLSPLSRELERAGLVVAAEASSAPHVPEPPLEQGKGARFSARVDRGAGLESVDLESAQIQGVGDETWTAELVIEFDTALVEAGPVLVTIEFAGEITVTAEGVQVASGFREASPMIAGPHYPLQVVTENSTRIEIHYRSGAAIAIPHTPVAPHLVVHARSLQPVIVEALAAAAQAPTTVLLAGRVTGEAMDADGLELPAGEGAVLEALLDAGHRVVVLTHGSGPIVMPWRSRAAGILHLGHPGERASQAIAALLSGTAEPGGRLVLTQPADAVLPIPAAAMHPDEQARLHYLDGIDVGCRAYERADARPAFPFGFGLGYAKITAGVPRLALDSEYDALESRGAPLAGAVVVPLSCGPERPGKAVVQLYARRSEGETLALVGWAVARLDAYESRELLVPVDAEALRIFDTELDDWRSPSGSIEVHAGLSRAHLLGSVMLPLDREAAADTL